MTSSYAITWLPPVTRYETSKVRVWSLALWCQTMRTPPVGAVVTPNLPVASVQPWKVQAPSR
jgi:hypothetical protein